VIEKAFLGWKVYIAGIAFKPNVLDLSQVILVAVSCKQNKMVS